METSAEIGELAKALASAQGVMQAAMKDAENPAFKRGNSVSKYADLASVWEACRAALSANGLCIIQGAETDEAGVRITTTLAHGSGQWMRSTLAIGCGDTAHAIGSAITYGRRYALAAMVGVAPEEDDDGNEASGVRGQQNGQREQPRRLADVAREAAQTSEPDPKYDAALGSLIVLGKQSATGDDLQAWCREHAKTYRALPVRSEKARLANQAMRKAASNCGIDEQQIRDWLDAYSAKDVGGEAEA